MEGRRYSEGLHQAIEAKEGVKVQKESMTLATITFQNFFRMYNKLAGMTGTAKTEEEEFQRIYNLEVVMVPTHKPVIRDDQDDGVYRNEQAKYKAVLDDIADAQERGQPVLVGTVAVETSERSARCSNAAAFPTRCSTPRTTSARRPSSPRPAGPGAVTIATNMAGRGVDILLGGNPEGLARDQLRRDGVDLTEVPQLAWNEAVDMLKHGEDPTTNYNTSWAQCPGRKVGGDRQQS